MRSRTKPRFFRSFLTPKKKLCLPLSACILTASSGLGGKGGATWKTKYLTHTHTDHHHHHHISVVEVGHLLTCSGLTHPEVSSKVCHNSFCQLGNSVSLPWVIHYEAFYLHVVSSFSCIPYSNNTRNMVMWARFTL